MVALKEATHCWLTSAVQRCTIKQSNWRNDLNVNEKAMHCSTFRNDGIRTISHWWKMHMINIEFDGKLHIQCKEWNFIIFYREEKRVEKINVKGMIYGIMKMRPS